MKKIFTAITVATLAASSLQAYEIQKIQWPDQSFTNARVERTPTSLVLTMDVNPAAFDLKSDRQVWLRPAVVGGADTLWFNPVIVAGRIRYIQNLRHNALPENTIQLHAGSPETYAYQAIVPYQEWMERCDLVLTGLVSGCSGNCVGPLSPDQPLTSCDFRDKTIRPVMVYVSPTKEIVKTRNVSGEAFIDFPVGKSQILPDFRRNPAELAEIRRTIDEVRNDRDITITSLSFEGYASPEGPYATNERLAKNRTEALIEYVRNLYAFPRDVMHSSWVAEDWAGLEKQLAKADIDDKDAIMAIVTDSSL
ncbi:MAG: hypothetical protein K2G40_04390, partial [Muribaculaceae bacterium]|nr:hypothetical protein [Muribaculaceae bacterium]